MPSFLGKDQLSQVIPNSINVPIVANESTTDLRSKELSPEAFQLCKELNLAEKLRDLSALRRQYQTSSNDASKQAQIKADMQELRQDLTEAVEQVRLEIEYVRSELYAEEALHNELLQAMMHERDEAVFRSNKLAFRSNGVLWAVTEALAIPSYKQPRYSIPSGVVGILAGVVPSFVSEIALREGKGHMVEREARPNMLCRVFNYPTVPRVDYPESVWNYLQSTPQNSREGKKRIDILIDQWIADKNLRILTDRSSKKQLDVVTGVDKQRLNIDLLSNRVSMLAELEALVALMNRPLLEIMMAVRGLKEIPE